MINTRIHFTDGSSVLKTPVEDFFFFFFFLEREVGSRESDNYQIKILTSVFEEPVERLPFAPSSTGLCSRTNFANL